MLAHTYIDAHMDVCNTQTETIITYILAYSYVLMLQVGISLSKKKIKERRWRRRGRKQTAADYVFIEC